MNTSTKLFVFGVVPVVAIAAIVTWKLGLLPIGQPASTAPAAASAAPAAVPVSVAAVLEQSVTEWDEFSGRVRAIDHVEVRPQVSGLITEVHFQDGQFVKKGDLLFTIDPRPFQAELAHEQAVLAAAQAKTALALTNLNRNKALIESHAIAQSELDATTDAWLEGDASVKAAEAAVQTAQLNLNYTAITAPVTGRASRAEITVGNLVNDGTSAPLLTTVVSVSPVYVEFELDEQAYLKYASQGANGNSGIDHIPVAMGLANEADFPHKGHLESFDNQLDTTSGTIRVRAVFDNATGLLTPGLYSHVRIGGAARSAILVDDRAVGTDQDKKYVMVIDADNKANYRAVVLGPMVNGLRVVRSGLSKGERIVVNGLQRVRPNTLVAPTDVAMDRDPSTKDDSEIATASAK
jgi:multidrug efflux system membrane fusion protein